MRKTFTLLLLSIITFSVFAQEEVNPRTNKVLKSGFFAEGLISAVSTKIPSFGYYRGFSKARRDAGAGIGFRIGNRFNFGSSTKYRPGMNLNYLRFQLFFTPGAASLALSPIGVGFTNTISFNENMGLEANLNIMFNFLIPIERNEYGTTSTEDGSDVDAYFGTIFGPSVKFRYKVLAVGLDMGFSPLINLDEGAGRGSYSYYGICVGVKI